MSSAASKSNSEVWGKRAQGGSDLVELRRCGGVVGLVEDRAHERGDGLLAGWQGGHPLATDNRKPPDLSEGCAPVVIRLRTILYRSHLLRR
jgi:hypothetical protein